MSTNDKGAITGELVDRIVREVIHQIEQPEKESPCIDGTVVLLTAYVPGYMEAVREIETAFGGTIEYIGFDGKSIPDGLRSNVLDAEEAGYEAVLDRISKKANVVLLAPSLTLLEDIAAGKDEKIAAYIMTRSLLWGKNVKVLLDFKPPQSKRNTFFEKVTGIIDVLESIGIDVMTYRSMPDPDKGKLPLVTERDIREAHRKGLKTVRKSAGAIVTPSAKDAAWELKISIE